MSWTLFAMVAVWSSKVVGANVYLPRATSTYHNATSISNTPATTHLTCCYLDSFNVAQLLWYTSSVEVTVATVSTIVYQYNNTAITSYSTRFVNNTLPTGYIIRENGGTISGVPSDIIGFGIGGYEAISTLVTGTVFTDPYGVKYTSPTPVWIYDYVTYRTSSPTLSGSTYACPTYAIGFAAANDIKPYPSGYYSVDPDPKYGQGNQGELFTVLPAGLKDWMVSHVPPDTNSIWSNLAGCTLGFGDGIPTAHVPVNTLTGSALTTTTIKGNFGSVIPSTTPMSVVVPPSPTQAPPPSSTAVVAPPPSSSAVVAPVSSSVAGESTPVTPPPQSFTSAIIPPQPTTNVGQSLSVAPAPRPSTSAIAVPSSTPPAESASASSGFVPIPVSNSASTNPATTVSPGSSSGGGRSPTVISPKLSHISNSIVGNPSVQPSSQIIGNPAGPTTAGNTPASMAPGNSQGNSVTLTTTPAIVAPVIIAGGTTIVGNSQSNFIIGSSTLTPGGTVVVPGLGTGSPIIYVLPTSGLAVIVNGATQNFQQTTIPALSPLTSAATIFTAGGSTFTENSASGFVIGSSTLTRGGTVIIPGSGTASATTFILPTSGSAIIINGATQSFQITTNVLPAPTMTTTPLLVVGSSIYTANSAGGFVIGSQTLTKGGLITQSGVTLSLATSGGTLVQASGGVTSTESLGGVILSVGGFGTSTSTSVPAQVTVNGGGRGEVGVWAVGGGMAGAVLGVLVL